MKFADNIGPDQHAHLSICCLLTYTTVSIDSVSGQRRPRSRRLIRAYVVHNLCKSPFRAVPSYLSDIQDRVELNDSGESNQTQTEN